MNQDLFYLYGKLIYRVRWLILALTIAVLAVSIPVLPKVIEPFTSTGFFDENSESAKANNVLNKQLGYSYNRFVILYSSPDLLASDPKFIAEIKNSLADLKAFPTQHTVVYPDVNKQQISADKHTAYVVVMFKSNQEVGHEFLTQFKSYIVKPRHLNMQIGGEPIFLDSVTKQTQIDLNKAEYIGTPAAIIMLLIIFGSVIAAFLPILLGAICGILILASLYHLGHIYSLSIFTINIALLVGLCLSLDYALLLISRFREQLHLTKNIEKAIAVTLGTAGKAVFFSGLAVFISLSALLFFPINILFSVGVGGLTAVFIAIIIALVILPAILSILKNHINGLPVHRFKKTRISFWQWFITKVVNHPRSYFCIILGILLILSYPILYVKFGISNFRILPKTVDSRQFFDTFKNAFGENELSPAIIVVQSTKDSITAPNNIARLYDFANTLRGDTRIHKVSSIVSTEPRLSKVQYQALYQMPPAALTPALKKLLEITTTKDFTILNAVPEYAETSGETKDLIKMLRHTNLGENLKLTVTGPPANTFDVLHGIFQVLPYSFLWIMLFTYLILLVLLRSIILPLKAIVTTTLSLTASYGMLIFIFQQGHFHEFLNFEAQEMLDISLCIIIFCAVFGFSMDYEVFLLTRIKECYEKTGNTRESIINGIDKSSRIITSAAIIVILICFSFMSADVLIVKAFGLGIAVAIFVDAFLIRLMLVPATMALLNDWSWYLPRWLNRILPKISFDVESKS
ncbi:MAG: MMPL family transporter [Gammaproteobacteria bacterium]|nr:MMPL family transporter [Gammaproteobacteria bacterium]